MKMKTSLSTDSNDNLFRDFESMKFIADHARSEVTLFTQVIISFSAKEASSGHVAFMYDQKRLGSLNFQA
jgi:hypothetical protein